MTSSSTLKLYRASAGSGKTYRLSLEFLKLLIVNPFNYSKILAVTFTNKATIEMQTRIMADLYTIICGQDEALLKTLTKELKQEYEDKNFSESLIQKNAKKALFNILHDYSHFQVSTIDSFFQIVLRNMAHELGLGAYLNIVIENGDTLDEAIQILQENFRTNANLRDWMNQFSQEKFDENKSWDLNNDLKIFGQKLFTEVYKNNEEVLNSQLSDREYLKAIKSSLYKQLYIKKKELNDLTERFDNILLDGGYCVDDLKYSSNGVYAFINSIKKGKCEIRESSRAYRGVYDPKWLDYWVGKDASKQLIQLVEEQLMPLLKNIFEVCENNMKDINTCILILEYFNVLGLLNDITQNIRCINSEKGQFLLGDTPNLLKSMIEDNDTPFIYEKIGTTLEHVMIDEFQDTSETQWGNFKPLIKECIDKGNMNLIVGDAKQSIYRFRNGDWNIIESLDDAFPGILPSQIKAEDNWRSMEYVVEFNNFLFSPSNGHETPLILEPFLENEICKEHPLFSKLKQVYVQSHQNCPKESQKGKGYVSVQFVSGDTENGLTDDNVMLHRLLNQVTSLQENGVKAKDITILCKRSKEITSIAEFFATYRDKHASEIASKEFNYNIISDDAYILNSSEALQMIINAMKISISPDDKIASLELYFHYMNIIKQEKEETITTSIQRICETLTNVEYENDPEYVTLMTAILNMRNLPLYELTEELIGLLHLEKLSNESAFLSTFLDYVNDFVARKSPDVSRFLDYWDTVLKAKKIPMSDNADGIHITTIHKSKGLEFHTVIVPFCSWEIVDSRHSELLWCSTDGLNEPYNQLPIVPIKFADTMRDSYFFKEYAEELVQLCADNINVLYVAFTRAVNNLIIISDLPKSDKKNSEKKSIGKVSDCLMQSLSAILEETDEKEMVELEDNQLKELQLVKIHYEKGNLTPSSIAENSNANLPKIGNPNPFKIKPDTIVCKYHYNKRTATFRNSTKADEYIQGLIDPQTSEQSEAVQRGLLLHYLFSNILTVNDIPSAADQLFFEGMIAHEKQRDELIKYAQTRIKEHEEWFSEGLKIYNECSILSKNERTGCVEISRPDRVIQQGNKMIIIDFKTGKKYVKYERQIAKYAQLLTSMGYETETHLWYLDEEEA